MNPYTYTVQTPDGTETIPLPDEKGIPIRTPTDAAERAEQLYPGEWSSVQTEGAFLTRAQWLAEREGFLRGIAQQVGGLIEDLDDTPGITVNVKDNGVTQSPKEGISVTFVPDDFPFDGPVSWSASVFVKCEFESKLPTRIPHNCRDTGRIVTWIKGILAGLNT